MKINWFIVDGSAQIRGVVAPQPATLIGLSSYSVPGPPANGMKVCMKADTRRILIPVAGTGRTLPETVQFGSLVSPAFCTGGFAPPVPKAITDESKVKSPWKPTILAPMVVVLSMSVVITGLI